VALRIAIDVVRISIAQITFHDRTSLNILLRSQSTTMTENFETKSQNRTPSTSSTELERSSLTTSPSNHGVCTVQNSTAAGDDTAEKQPQSSQQDVPEEEASFQYPSNKVLLLIMPSLFLAMFLVALVSTKIDPNFIFRAAYTLIG
jgi:hypothetical protein